MHGQQNIKIWETSWQLLAASWGLRTKRSSSPKKKKSFDYLTLKNAGNTFQRRSQESQTQTQPIQPHAPETQNP